MENGPFRQATRVPLVYSFAGAEEEKGFIEYARKQAHELRRDLRLSTALIVAVIIAGTSPRRTPRSAATCRSSSSPRR